MIETKTKYQLRNRTKEKVFCRICNNKNIEYFYFDTPIFPLKNKNDWGNYYCTQCHCVSHFNFKNSKTIYSDGSYRERNVGFHENLNEKEISPPIDLPWSTITFLRWEQAASKLKKYLNIQNKNKINFLDFGGYNGLTAYGIKNYFNIKNVTIADLDLKGLKTAQSYGFSILDLSNSDLPKNKYDLITSIQVLEHLERPSDTLLSLKNSLKEEGVIYIEVPNLFALPLSDNSHLSMFSIEAVEKMFNNLNLKILESGFLPSRKELIDLGVFYFSKKEAIYLIAKKDSKYKRNIDIKENKKLQSLDDFKYDLQLTYAKLSLFEISFNIFKKIKLLVLYFFYYFFVGGLNLIGLRIYRKFNSYKFFYFLKKLLKKTKL